MFYEECEELIQMEAEHLSEVLYNISYFELTPQLKSCVRARAIAALWPELVNPRVIAAA